MFSYDEIDEYQLEITSYCNASCPQCPRNINGAGINPYMPLQHLPRSVIDRAFPESLCQRLRQVFFCGSYGDPIMHPDFLDILRDFRAKNPKLWLYMHTNGGVHDPDYWREIARIMGGYGQIDFGIDGLADTLDLYRVNVKFDRVMANAQAFIQAGGRAQWNFIVFRHNEHQVDQVQELAAQMGFANVLVRRTGRFFNHTTLKEMPFWPVTNRDYVLEPPQSPQYRNASMMNLADLHEQYPDMQEYFRTTEIRCDALLGRKVSINALGLVLPCNFFFHNLYDARFHDNTYLPGAHVLSSQDDRNQVAEFIDRYGRDNLNINHVSLETVFASQFWQDLVDSWHNQERLFECAMTCGAKLTKVWDQGGSTR